MNNEDRQKMINSINNVKTNKKFVDTFFSLNGRNPSETEIQSIEDSIHLNMDINETNGSIRSNEFNKSDCSSESQISKTSV